MSRSPEEIEKLYERIESKKKAQGKNYRKIDFINDLGLDRAGTYSDWVSGQATPGRQSELLMDVLEKRELP